MDLFPLEETRRCASCSCRCSPLASIPPAASLDAQSRPAAPAASPPATLEVPYRQFQLAKRAQRHHAPRHQCADRHGERLVPRRLGQRAARAHGLRAPVRAPDVRGLEEREGGRVRHPARGRRWQQQRLHDQRPHQLRDRRARKRVGAGALSRVGSHGIPAGHDVAGAGGRPARRGEERAAPELREPPLRHGIAGDRQDAVAGQSPLQLADDRPHGGFDGREPRRRGAVLQDLLRAQQRQPRDRRRHRLRSHQGAGREVVRRDSAGCRRGRRWRRPAPG